jgi:integrase
LSIGAKEDIIVDEGNPRKEAPIKSASTHDLRRTFAQRLADAGVAQDEVRKLMRHKDIKTTERYYQVAQVQRDAGRLRDILGVPKKSGTHKSSKKQKTK